MPNVQSQYPHSLCVFHVCWETERLRDAMQRELADAKAQHILRHRTREFQRARHGVIYNYIFLHEIMILYGDLTYSIIIVNT